MKKYYHLAGLTFSINVNDKYSQALAAYFSDKEIATAEEEPLLEIDVSSVKTEKEFHPEYFSLSGKISFNHTSFRIKGKRVTYVVSNLFDDTKTTRVVFAPGNISWLYRQLMALGGMGVGDHCKYALFTSDVANYSCLWYIFAITLMKREQVFVHCGMMQSPDKERGTILTGTGGCGKTSMMMEIITHAGYRYMAEDFGIVGADGSIYDMQKKAAIYQSDVKWGNPYLKKAIANLPAIQRIEWTLKKMLRRNPRHYFKPSELFGGDIGHKAQLEKVFYLKRAVNDSNIQRIPLAAEQLAERAKTATFREVKELYEILGNIRAVGGNAFYESYPSISELETKYKSILVKALDGVKCFELEVPMNVNPKYAVDYIVGK